MTVIEVLKRDDLKRMLLDAVTDAELVTLIDHLTEARAALVARQCVAPCDQDDAVQRAVAKVEGQHSTRCWPEACAQNGTESGTNCARGVE